MIYLLIPVIIVCVDMYIKNYIEKNKEVGSAEELFGGRIILRRSHNTGAMLNFMEKKQQLVAGFSLGLSIAVVVGYLVLLMQKGRHLLKLALSFIVGGAISNVYDRLVRHYVVDYFSFNMKKGKLKSIVFNLADIFIFLGSFLSIIENLWNSKQKS